MSPRPTMRGKDLPRLALSNALTREALPAPLVYYPSQQGAFFAFAASRDLPPALCACTEGAIRNLFRLAPPGERLLPSDYALFPEIISRALLGPGDPFAALHFRSGLCHRCKLTPPTLRYCHPAAGQGFVQTYGWYINQTYLRLGIHPTTLQYLPDVCPPEYHPLLDRIHALQRQLRDVRAELIARGNEPRREIPRSEQSHLPNVSKADLAPLEEIEWQMGRPRRELANAVQNVVRAEFGVKAVGDGWVSETMLYRLVCRLCPGEQVFRHYRPEWLDGLELDIYLPQRNLAIEYQGQQHFYPIKAWGGEEALRQLQARDARKAEICREVGLPLVTVDYTEPITEEHIAQVLADGSRR